MEQCPSIFLLLQAVSAVGQQWRPSVGENKQFGQGAHIQTGLHFQNWCILISLRSQKVWIHSLLITDTGVEISRFDLLHPLRLNVLACAFFQGNLFDFLRLTGWRGSKVLYFGDHLYSDLAVSFTTPAMKYHFLLHFSENRPRGIFRNVAITVLNTRWQHRLLKYGAAAVWRASKASFAKNTHYTFVLCKAVSFKICLTC